MNCGMECVKYLLFVFNFVCALGGLLILALGILALTWPEMEVVKEARPENFSFEHTTYALIAIGAIIFVITFFGCCGAIRESHCMIVTYGVLLLTLLVIQVAIASYLFIKFSGQDAERSITQAGQKFFKSVNDPQTDQSVKNVWHNLEKIGVCCGFDSFTDYTSQDNQYNIPGSCCNREFEYVCSAKAVRDTNHTDGCKSKIYELFKKSSNILGIAALCIAGIELIGIIFSFCLANSILNVERRGYKV